MADVLLRVAAPVRDDGGLLSGSFIRIKMMKTALGRPVTLRKHLSLESSLGPRLVVEKHFAQLGHTYRHGRLYRWFEHQITRPTLKLGLQMAGLYSRGARNAITPMVRRVSLEFPNLPAALNGFQILHLSDFHIEGTPGLTESLAPILSSLRPDVCVMTGDYRFEDHGSSEPVWPLMRKVVSAIHAPLGIFGILGNHDSSEIAHGMEELGVRMLINEAVGIGDSDAPLWLAGVDDPFDYQCHDLARALELVPDGSFTVLLAHAPEIFEEAESEGVNLYLSGHTHAGQIRLPGIGAVRQNARCPRAYTAGHWTHGRMQGYTSAGVGCSGLPVRFGCPPEIVLLELRRSPELP